MDKQIKTLYHKFRATQMGGIVGEDAKSCLRNARTLAAWNKQESDGNVKIQLESETDHPFDIYGKPDTESECKRQLSYMERYGVYCVMAYYKCPCCDQWKLADNIGMCIFKDPVSPFDNPYVIDLMESALDQYMAHIMGHVETLLDK